MKRLILPMILCLAGCAHHVRGEAKKFIGAIHADAISIRDNADALTGHVDDAGKPLVSNIKSASDRQLQACDGAVKAIDADDKQLSKLDQLSGTIGVKLERLAWGSLFALGGLWIAANVLRFFVPADGALSALLDWFHSPVAAIRGMRTHKPRPNPALVMNPFVRK